MKQETGNNLYVENHRELSIQITLSGFSFSMADNGGRHRLYSEQLDHYDFATAIDRETQFDSIKIGWATDLVQLIPTEIFDESYTISYLKSANMLPPASVALFNQTLIPSITAVWSVHQAIFEAIDSLYPTAYHYHNLLVDISLLEKQSVRVTIDTDTANITVANAEGLWAAETVKVTTPENLLYTIMKLNAVDSFTRNTLTITANNLQAYTELINRNFVSAELIESPNIYHNIIPQCE